MKIEITTEKANPVQEFFAQPLDLSQRVEVKKLLLVERILDRMKALGLNRKSLAQRMEVSPARITRMMDGTNNFTLETLMRAAEAVDSELELTLIPKGQKVRWIAWEEDQIHAAFRPHPQPILPAAVEFVMGTPSPEGHTDAA